MGAGSSRLDTRWWEAESQQKLITTTNIGKVEVICSLIPGLDHATIIGHLKSRSDLDTLFALHCRSQNFLMEQPAGPSTLTADFKAYELWRVLQTPPGYCESPWDWNWQPPLEGVPSEIAAEFHAVACRAIFRVPFFDFVQCALGYSGKAQSASLLYAVSDVRDGLRRAFQARPSTREIYLKVEKVRKRRNPSGRSANKIRHWNNDTTSVINLS
jgi:hypothetical protein